MKKYLVTWTVTDGEHEFIQYSSVEAKGQSEACEVATNIAAAENAGSVEAAGEIGILHDWYAQILQVSNVRELSSEEADTLGKFSII